MAISDEQKQKDMEDYAAAFGEDMQPTEAPDEFADTATSDVSADEAAPVTVEAEPAEPVPAESTEAPTEEASAEEAMTESAPATEAPAPVSESPAEASPASESISAEDESIEYSADVPPEDKQNYKTWVGRMRKQMAALEAREAELAAREAALAEQPAADEGGQVEMGVEEAPAEMSSSLSPEQALQQLRADFGDDFVNAIVAIAKSTAQSVAGESVGSGVAEAIEAMNAMRERYDQDGLSEHMEFITDHHPDFMEVGSSEAFKQWLSDKPEMQACCEHGSKRAVVKMLSAFKEAQKEANNDEGLDDLTVVQSSGVVIPAKKGDGFEAAWNEF